LNASAAAALLLALLAAAGFVVLLVVEKAPQEVEVEIPEANLPAIETLCGEVALGGMPRLSAASDTTVLVMDLDSGRYSMAQANLALTRDLARAGCTLVRTVARPDGGLDFLALHPDGSPLRLELKPVGSS